GKNPTYHAGKIYTVLAQRLANELHQTTAREIYVNVVTDNGRPLDDPKLVAVRASGRGDLDAAAVDAVVLRHLDGLQDLIRSLGTDGLETHEHHRLPSALPLGREDLVLLE